MSSCNLQGASSVLAQTHRHLQRPGTSARDAWHPLPKCRLDCRANGSVHFHLHEVVEKCCPGAEVGEGGAGGGVAIGAVQRVAIPPDALRDNDAGLDGFTNDGTSPKAAAIIEDSDPVA